MKALRIAITLLVAGFAAFLLFRTCFRHAAEPPVAPPAAAPALGTVPLFPPLDGQGGAENPSAGATHRAPTKPRVEPPRGTPVKEDAVVPVDVPYRVGTKSRYLLREATLDRDQRPPNETSWGEYVWTIATEVVKAESDDVRIKFEIESFDWHTDGPAARIEFSSEKPDRELLKDPGFELELRPWMAVRRTPVEIVLGAGGAIREVRGAEAMTNKYLDAVDKISAAAAESAVNAPTAESVRQRWADLLFPAFGGGAMKASETRETAFATTYAERWAAVASGAFRVTHDDPDVFRVEFKGTPKVQELNRDARTAYGKAVAKVNVQASADSFVASWRVDRKVGRVVSAELEAKYAVWISFFQGNTFAPTFTDVERISTVELLEK